MVPSGAVGVGEIGGGRSVCAVTKGRGSCCRFVNCWYGLMMVGVGDVAVVTVGISRWRPHREVEGGGGVKRGVAWGVVGPSVVVGRTIGVVVGGALLLL